jgi:hypothetical protein
MVKNLKEVDDLISLLNSKLSNPDLTTQMLLKANKEFNLHEYLNMFGTIARISISYVLEPYFFRDYFYKQLDGVRKVIPNDRTRLFDLSNKSTLNHIPTTPIKCIPELNLKQLKKFTDFNYMHLIINKYLKDFIEQEFKDELIENPELDPAIQKLDQVSDIPDVQVDEDQSIPEIGLEDFDNSDDTQEHPVSLHVSNPPPSASRTKYLVQEKDYAKLYLKYKQKYLNLKNKMNN